jgi:hypothetical protein
MSFTNKSQYTHIVTIDNKSDNEFKTHIPFFTNISFINVNKIDQIKDILHIYISISDTETVLTKNNNFMKKLPLLTEKVNKFVFYVTTDVKIELMRNKYINKEYIFGIYHTPHTFKKWTRNNQINDFRNSGRSRSPIRDTRKRYRSRSRDHDTRKHYRSRSRDYDTRKHYRPSSYDCDTRKDERSRSPSRSYDSRREKDGKDIHIPFNGFVPNYWQSIPFNPHALPYFNGHVPHFNGHVPQFNGHVPQFNGHVPQHFNGHVPQHFNGHVPQFNGHVPQHFNGHAQPLFSGQ